MRAKDLHKFYYFTARELGYHNYFTDTDDMLMAFQRYYPNMSKVIKSLTPLERELRRIK